MTYKKFANIVINNMLGHFKRAKRMPDAVDADFLAETVWLIDNGYVSSEVFKDKAFWHTILTVKSSSRLQMVRMLFDSEHFLARDFFKEIINNLNKKVKL